MNNTPTKPREWTLRPTDDRIFATGPSIAIGEKIAVREILLEQEPSKLPESILAPPSPPDGFRWEYRGTDWKSPAHKLHACYYPTTDEPPEWVIHESCENSGWRGCHYLEAIPIEPPAAPPCHLEARVARLEAELLNRAHQDAPDAPQAILAQNTGITVKEGKWYEREDGEITGPARPNTSSSRASYPWIIQGQVYTAQGRFYHDAKECPADLVREVPAPFDMEKLWSELPCWLDYLTMDEDDTWTAHTITPRLGNHGWRSNDRYVIIPAEHAPPRASDWTASLTVRPGLEVQS